MDHRRRGGIPVKQYHWLQTPPDEWTRVAATVTEDGAQVGIQVFDSGGVDFQIRQLSYRQSDYALPFTGLAAGSTRAKTIATAPAIPGDDCSLILAVIPYGKSITDEIVYFCTNTSWDWDYFNVFAGGTPDRLYAFRSGNAGANNANWSVERADFASLDMFVQDKITTLGVDFVAGESVIGYVNGSRAGASSNTLPTPLDAINEVTVGHSDVNINHVNGAVAGMLARPRLTVAQHAAIDTCLRTGTYYEPKA